MENEKNEKQTISKFSSNHINSTKLTKTTLETPLPQPLLFPPTTPLSGLARACTHARPLNHIHLLPPTIYSNTNSYLLPHKSTEFQLSCVAPPAVISTNADGT